MTKELDVATFGQVFTNQETVRQMIALIQNDGKILEPSAGDGAFASVLSPEKTTAIEFDPYFAEKHQFLNLDFFQYPSTHTFSTIIGNPPYVRYQDIHPETKDRLSTYNTLFDERSNIYLFFIYKCVLHLEENGELIFITPREFIKATSARKLNQWLYAQGTITHYIEMGDKKIFKDAVPNTAIWRFQKGNFSRKTNSNQNFMCLDGQLVFTQKDYSIPFSRLAFVKVGAVSGADKYFKHPDGTEFVCSKTAKTGETRFMIYDTPHDALLPYKEALLRRRIKKFTEENWWSWGRKYYVSDKKRIYVNALTRNQRPFFLSDVKAYDGSVLAIFPTFKCSDANLLLFCRLLNGVDWDDLGFIVDGRFKFTQRTLENILLPQEFECFLQEERLTLFHSDEPSTSENR